MRRSRSREEKEARATVPATLKWVVEEAAAAEAASERGG